MRGCLNTQFRFSDPFSQPDASSDRFHSVEFSVNGLKLLYQSKLWNNANTAMFALIKENSDVLERIRVGDVLNMKFYTADAMGPTKNYDTKIEYITRDRQGRFKGHYLVGLAIVADSAGDAVPSPERHPV